MQVNRSDQLCHKPLMQAVVAAATMLAISAHNQAFALGLGDIDVKSHLGQPLRAKIKVLGGGDLKDADCFRLASDPSNPNQLNSAHFKLGSVTGDDAMLTVSTNDIINEPIVNLSIIVDCDTSLRRDYVLLMDPVLTAETDSANHELSNDTVENSKVSAQNKFLSQNIATPAAEPQVVQASPVQTKKTSAKKQRANKKSSKNISLNAINDATYGALGNANSETRPRPDANLSAQNPSTSNLPKENLPRLSVSNGASSNALPNMIGLRMDNQLHYTPDSTPIEMANDIAVQDEVTVMNNRLAHLKMQVDKLKLRNDTLENDNKIKTEQIIQAQEKLPGSPIQWIAYITYAVLLIGGYFLANWWRRRSLSLQLEDPETIWENLHSAATKSVRDDATDGFFDSKSAQKPNADDESSTLHAGDFEATQAVEAPFFVEEDNSESNILDHADVFLSHGRTSLAIQLLQNHLLDFPKQSVTIWLFLLDLVAKVNLQAVYEQTAIECKEHFNIKIPEFGTAPDVAYSETTLNQSLESFPRLTTGLQQVWGTPAAITFLDDLIYNSRLEVRVGFDKNVIEELILLKNMTQENLKTAVVIQMDEKKVAIKEQKEAQIAAKKAEKLHKMDELPSDLPAITENISEKVSEPKAASKMEELPPLEFTIESNVTNIDVNKPAGSFEFNLVEINQKH